MTPIPTERVRELRDKYTQLAAQYQEMDLPKSRDQWLDLAAMASEILTRRDAEAREGLKERVDALTRLAGYSIHLSICSAWKSQWGNCDCGLVELFRKGGLLPDNKAGEVHE